MSTYKSSVFANGASVDAALGKALTAVQKNSSANALRLRPSVIATDAPTITYSATIPTNGCTFPPLPKFVSVVGGSVVFDTTYSVWNLNGKGGFSGIETTLIGDSITFVWKCDVSQSEKFMFFVDGCPVSLSPQTPSVTTSAAGLYSVTLSFSSYAVRRIEIVCTAIKGIAKILVPYSCAVVNTGTARKRKIHIVGDSFNVGSNAISGDYTKLPGSVIARKYDCSVSLDALGGTGYVSAGSYTAFGDSSRIANASAIKPDDIVIMGSVNDDGKSYIYEAALSLFNTYKSLFPDSRIFIFGPQPTNAASTLSANRKSNCLSVRAAATAAGVNYVDMCGYETSDVVSAFATGVTYDPGIIVTSLGSIWKHSSTNPRTYSSNNAPGSGNYGYWELRSSYLFGTGKIGSLASDGSRDTFLYSDGIHPTAEYCAVLAEMIVSAISGN